MSTTAPTTDSLSQSVQDINRGANHDNIMWTHEFCEPVDEAFIARVKSELTLDCALPMFIPETRIAQNLISAAMWFWENVEASLEQRMYVIKNRDIRKHSALNKFITVPQQIMMITNVYRLQERIGSASLGDFSIERLMMHSYAFGTSHTMPTTLNDVVVNMYEISTLNNTLNPPISFNFNEYSSRLVLLGDLGSSDIVVDAYVRTTIQELYNSYQYYKLVVGMCKKDAARAVGTMSFKLPGGVEVDTATLSQDGETAISEVKEWADNQRGAAYFYTQGTK